MVKLFQERLSTLNDFVERADPFFVEDIKMDPDAQAKYLAKDLSKEFLLFIERLEGLANFTVEEIEGAFRALVGELSIDSKQLIHPIRVALTGKTVGPGLFDVIYYLGKERVQRLMQWVKRSEP